MVRDLTPLGIVQHDLTQHTSRNPSGVEAVMSTIRDAVATLGQDHASDFSQRLVHSLDPHTRDGLGVSGAEALEKLGNLAANPEAERSERWGATSLLGVLAMTHRPDMDQLTPENIRTQIAGTLARTALTQLIRSETAEPEQVAIAEAFLAHAGVSTEDVATELHLEGFVDAFNPKSKEGTTFELPTDEAEILMGSHISKPFDYDFASLLPNIADKIKKMSWIHPADIPDITTARKVFHDGKHIATILDMTPLNTTLNEFHEELVADKVRYRLFWGQMAKAIVQREASSRSDKRVVTGKTTIYYMASKTQTNGHAVRGYYSPLCRDPETGAEILGLIAATRSKHHQSRVYKLIANRA